MFLNPSKLGKKRFKCNERVMKSLVYDYKLPLLAINRKSGEYYFALTDELKKAIEDMPIWFKFVNGVELNGEEE